MFRGRSDRDYFWTCLLGIIWDLTQASVRLWNLHPGAWCQFDPHPWAMRGLTISLEEILASDCRGSEHTQQKVFGVSVYSVLLLPAQILSHAD